MSKNNSFISFERVSYYYSGIKEPAISDIDATIQRGEFIAILGANGSGKSTLARHMNALLLPSKGKVSVCGLDSQKDMKKVREKVSMVFQNPDNQLVATLVEEDVAFGPENLGVSSTEIRQRVKESLLQVGLWGMKDKQPHMLSGGQKQRLAIAGALAMHAECMVLDEPTAMLDPKGRNEVLSLLLQLKKQKQVTLVLITHLMEEAFLADKIWVMKYGKLIAQDSPRKIFGNLSLLDEAGLEPLESIKFAETLRQAGCSIDFPFTMDELVDYICQ